MAETINYIHNNLVDVYLEEPYNLIDIELESSPNCTICFGICSETENIYSMSYNRKDCNCSYDVHEKCLDKWLEKHNTCIICRNSITKNTTQTIIGSVSKCVHYVLWGGYYILLVIVIICIVIITVSLIHFLF